MKSNVLTVVIDERAQLERIEEAAFLEMMNSRTRNLNTTSRVFKDYILSSEIYEIPAYKG